MRLRSNFTNGLKRLPVRVHARLARPVGSHPPSPRLVLVLCENWTMTSPRDLRALVRIAQEAEDAGIDGVMLSEHIVLGPSAGAGGRPANPRDYAAPGNQDPGHAVARLDRADERDRRRHHARCG